ncbi:MAG: M3 family oligoendopeptidase [Chloroflexia bacterium]
MSGTSTTSTTTTLPHWDMTVVYPALSSPEFEAGFVSVVGAIERLEALFDEHNVAKQESVPVTAETVAAFDAVANGFNTVLEEVGTLSAYVYSFVSTDSRDDQAQARLSELEQHTVRLSQLDTRFTAWIGSLDVEALIGASSTASDHAYALRRAKVEAAHQMSPVEEEIATELNLSSGSAWTKLHNNIASQLAVSVEIEGETRVLPMSMVRNLAQDPNRETRRAAYEAEIAEWERSAVPLAAALNSIKGQVNTLSRRRGWESPLEESLFNNAIDRAALDAMLDAAREYFPHFRRYLRAKAQMLGLPALAWYDIAAPIAAGGREWSYDEGTRFIAEQFGAYSAKMRDFAQRAFDENWIDAEPRPGKSDGAFCMPLRGEESRILSNYQPTFGGVSTLAHELGHGYHNLTKAHRTPIQRSTPMTLAETASIFCETIAYQAAVAQASPEEQVALLESSLEGSCQIVVDISSRFIFEQSVFEKRRERELSVEELNELMLDAQRQTYGDGLDANVLHPYMWAVKGHYYSVGRSYYNYPYMFGLLFGLGLYARYTHDAEGFKRGYDELLASTGLADAAELGARFDIDIRTTDFWRSSLDVLREQVERFECWRWSRRRLIKQLSSYP